MKKIVLAVLMAVSAVAGYATEVQVNGIRNSMVNNETGYNVSVAQPVAKGLTATAEFENTAGQPGTNVNTGTVGARYDAFKVYGVTLTGVGKVGYSELQATSAKGTFVKFGAEAATPVPYVTGLTANVGLVRQLGTSSVMDQDHTEGYVGARYSVTKDIAVNGGVTFYDNIGGNKATAGVSYAF